MNAKGITAKARYPWPVHQVVDAARIAMPRKTAIERLSCRAGAKGEFGISR
jgi:hypothetical protein